MKRRAPARSGAANHLAVRIAGITALVVAALAAGCSSSKHHRVLSLFFDGVPEPRTEVASDTPAAQASLGRQLVRVGEHGPYAAKLCDSCHDSKATNVLVVPAEQLCLRCHELGAAKAYVHGPLASGGCLVCHDPHRSANRFLLVSASDSFCLQCHERAGLSVLAVAEGSAGATSGNSGAGADGSAAGDGHAGDAADCTECHDAHMSDRRYLLREGR